MKNMCSKSIPNCLKRYRKAKGLKQKEVAEILELKGTSMISRWEKGVCFPKPLNIFRLAVLYRTMVDALFRDLRSSLKEEIQKKEQEVLKKKNETQTQKQKGE
jgi:transcriptional regulator with XRE-family HTH domain